MSSSQSGYSGVYATMTKQAGITVEVLNSFLILQRFFVKWFLIYNSIHNSI